MQYLIDQFSSYQNKEVYCVSLHRHQRVISALLRKPSILYWCKTETISRLQLKLTTLTKLDASTWKLSFIFSCNIWIKIYHQHHKSALNVIRFLGMKHYCAKGTQKIRTNLWTNLQFQLLWKVSQKICNFSIFSK